MPERNSGHCEKVGEPVTPTVPSARRLHIGGALLRTPEHPTLPTQPAPADYFQVRHFTQPSFRLGPNPMEPSPAAPPAAPLLLLIFSATRITDRYRLPSRNVAAEGNRKQMVAEYATLRLVGGTLMSSSGLVNLSGSFIAEYLLLAYCMCWLYQVTSWRAF